jgi:hypothetical protein
MGKLNLFTYSIFRFISSLADSIRINPCPEMTAVNIEHTLNILHLPTKCYVKIAHSHCIDAIAIHKKIHLLKMSI